MSDESMTPRTDKVAVSNRHPVEFLEHDIVSADFARTIERELNKAKAAYQTVKEWAHRVEGNLTTIIARCDDIADGTDDNTSREKFANELIGLSNEIVLGEARSLTRQLAAQQQEILALQRDKELALRVTTESTLLHLAGKK